MTRYVSYVMYVILYCAQSVEECAYHVHHVLWIARTRVGTGGCNRKSRTSRTSRIWSCPASACAHAYPRPHPVRTLPRCLPSPKRCDWGSRASRQRTAGRIGAEVTAERCSAHVGAIAACEDARRTLSVPAQLPHPLRAAASTLVHKAATASWPSCTAPVALRFRRLYTYHERSYRVFIHDSTQAKIHHLLPRFDAAPATFRTRARSTARSCCRVLRGAQRRRTCELHGSRVGQNQRAAAIASGAAPLPANGSNAARREARSTQPQRQFPIKPPRFRGEISGSGHSGSEHVDARHTCGPGAARARDYLGAHARSTRRPQSSWPAAWQPPRSVAIRSTCVRARLRGEIRQSPRTGEGDFPANRRGSRRGVHFTSINRHLPQWTRNNNSARQTLDSNSRPQRAAVARRIARRGPPL